MIAAAAGAFYAAAGGVLYAGSALACELPAGTRVESPRYALSYRTIPAQITVEIGGAHV